MTDTLIREMSGPVEVVDASTIAGRIVPWECDTEVFEIVDGRSAHYVERWQRGAFDAQARSTNRGTVAKIELRESHLGGLGKVGYALSFDGRDDGEYAVLRVLPRYRDDVAQMVDDGIDGFSVGFHPKRGGTVRTRAASSGDLDVLLRTDAHLEHIALVADPAYAQARVLEMREAAEADQLAEARRAANLAAIDELLEQRDRWSSLTVR